MLGFCPDSMEKIKDEFIWVTVSSLNSLNSHDPGFGCCRLGFSSLLRTRCNNLFGKKPVVVESQPCRVFTNNTLGFHQNYWQSKRRSDTT